MKDSFRQSMAWLHTWCGLACGWLLCAIFLTGSLSVFRDPITRWMEAQPLATVAQGERLDTARAVDHAARYLGEHAAGARFWRVQLPQHPGEAMTLTSRLGAGTRHVALSADNGAPLTQGLARKTEGGRHFMSFHYMLHLPVLGFWLVGGLTLGLLVALISGVVVHRRIFLDFFTFRPGRGPRSWLDAHNATAVMTLPFLLMIAYTGLSIFYTSYMPGPLRAVYGAEPDAYSRFQSDLSNSAQLPLSPLGPEGQTVTSQWSELMQRAQVLLGQPARLLLIDRPGAPGMSVRVLGQADTARPSQALFTPQGQRPVRRRERRCVAGPVAGSGDAGGWRADLWGDQVTAFRRLWRLEHEVAVLHQRPAGHADDGRRHPAVYDQAADQEPARVRCRDCRGVPGGQCPQRRLCGGHGRGLYRLFLRQPAATD
ncbi:MAG: PepSY-associated TM helix domain-containing protein [Candidatus Pseudomonas colombiensis]|nr:MAG: PepSY-associated TM helix domain-containing protein [Pseudomonas sp.]